VFIELMGRARTISNERSQSNQWRHSGILARTYAMLVKEFLQLRRDPGFIRDDRDVADHAAPAVRLCHQHHAASSADRRVAAGGQRPRRSILKALQNTAYFRFTRQVQTVEIR
jgi:ABC-2 type transport system permease protein